MVVERATGRLQHRHFRDVGEFLRAGDLLVLNDSRVIPARLFARRHPWGGGVELLLVHEVEPLLWQTLVRPGKKIQKGDRLLIAAGRFEAEIVGYAGRGERLVRFDLCGNDWNDLLDRYGHTPLPPYILKARKQANEPGGDTPEDRERYQTVYATAPGSVAAPTAGFHFTTALMGELKERGVEFARVTLHIGPGTFQPLTDEHLNTQQLHEEYYSLDAGEVETIDRARREGRRIIPVGTTAVRVLESACDDEGRLVARRGATRLFIAPGYRFRLADALLTNFHLPRSSLLLLVCAFAERETILRAYREAMDGDYRFYSYGDAMLLL